MTFTKPALGPDRVPETLSITATNATGKVRFVVRILRKGDRYGLDDVLTWDKDRPGVEFYDARYDHTRFGQFVSRYYVETIQAAVPIGYATHGLDLMGHEPSWKIDGKAMRVVRQWLYHETGIGGTTP
jgi:hypothetical protein